MEFFNYLGIIVLLIQIMFCVLFLIMRKKGIPLSQFSIALVRFTVSAVLLAILVLVVHTSFNAYIASKKVDKPLKPYSQDKVALNAILEPLAKKYGVPISIAKSLIHQESRYNIYAISKAQAVGVCQILPSTFVAHAEGTDYNMFNPSTNIEVSMRILANSYKYTKNWPETLGRYNAGSYYKCEEAQIYVAEVLSRVQYK